MQATARATRQTVINNINKDKSGDEALRRFLRVKMADYNENENEFSARFGISKSTYRSWYGDPERLTIKKVRMILRKLGATNEEIISFLNL